MSQTLINIFYQSHAGSWAITILLFFISYFLLKAGKVKIGKILHMVLRLFYLIMIISGGALLFAYTFPLGLVFKAVLALVLIYSMEMILVKTQKGTLANQAVMYWSLFVITVLVVPMIGFGVI